MPVRDCGYCETLRCSGELHSTDTFQALVANLLCEMTDNQENIDTGFPRILELLEDILAALGGP